MSNDPREYIPEEIKALRKVLDSQSAQIGEAMRAVAGAATAPGLEMARQAAEQVSKVRLLALDIPDPIQREPMPPLEVPKPREFYIVDAIQDTGEVLNASLDIQRTQAEEIAKMRQSVDHQTTLTRWVLGVAAAAFAVSALSIAATVLVALFVV